MQTRKVKYLIIGAGPAGLGAAYRLKEIGQTDYLIVERSPWVGGLATSFLDDQGFTWDIGGHVQFSHYKYFDDVMDAALGVDGWWQHERESWVWMRDRFVPYPFQNNIRYLPKEDVLECLRGAAAVQRGASSGKPANFHEWILSIFGQGIADQFMLPYNFKVWAYPPSEMAYQWIGERVSVVDFDRVLKNVILQLDDLSWGPNNTFRFPKHGGTGAVWNAVGKIVGSEKIMLDSTVVEISSKSRSARLANGDLISFEHVLSTLPIDNLVNLIPEAPKSISARAAALKYSATNIVGVGLKGQPKDDLKTKCWMYFPEPDCPFYRVTLFSKYSPFNVPDVKTHFSLMTETSESPAKAVDHKMLIQQTIAGLRATKLVSDKDQIVSTWMYHAPYGYPTPSIERDAILKDVFPWLEENKLYSRGRFGAWKYEISNQDHTFMQGVEWSNRIAQGQPETTFSI